MPPKLWKTCEPKSRIPICLAIRELVVLKLKSSGILLTSPKQNHRIFVFLIRTSHFKYNRTRCHVTGVPGCFEHMMEYFYSTTDRSVWIRSFACDFGTARHQHYDTTVVVPHVDGVCMQTRKLSTLLAIERANIMPTSSSSMYTTKCLPWTFEKNDNWSTEYSEYYSTILQFYAYITYIWEIQLVHLLVLTHVHPGF
jgi:hypothetical protein